MLALQKLADVRRKLAELNRIDAVLVNMIAQCGAADGHVQCPMIVSLLDTPGMPT
jgi:MerR family mercuric resistance operon transcriptional regulator